MGACATKFKVLKDAGDAPAPVPVPAEEVSSKDVAPVEKEVKTEGGVVDDEAKHQSLGHLFENEGPKGASEQVKQEEASEARTQENECVKSAEVFVDAPVKLETSEEKKTEDNVEDKQVVEPQRPEQLEVNKSDEKVKEAESAKPEEVASKTEEQKAPSDTEKPKA